MQWIFLFLAIIASLCGEAKRVVIGGAGPIGLYAALTFYEEGFDVTLVNDRTAYTRLQIVGLDPPWVQFFKRISPDTFKRLIDQGRARMTISGSVEMVLSDVEKLMWEKLLKLEGKRMKLLQGVPLEALYESGNQAFARVSGAFLPFDLLLFAGGAHDKLRALELAVPIAVHEAVPFSLEMFESKKKFFPISQEKQAAFVRPDLESISEALREEVCRIAEEDIELGRIYGYVAHHLPGEVGLLDTRFFENSAYVAVAVEWSHPLFVCIQRLAKLKGTVAKEAQERFFKIIHDKVVETALKERGVSVGDSKSYTRFFVQQTRLAEGEVNFGQTPAKLYAIGDALVTPHFFSRGGLESGRLSVQNVLRRYVGGDKETFEKERRFLEQKALDFGNRPFTKPRPTAEELRLAKWRAEAPFKELPVRCEKGRYLVEAGGERLEFDIAVIEKDDPFYPYEVRYVSGEEIFPSFGALIRLQSPTLSATLFNERGGFLSWR